MKDTGDVSMEHAQAPIAQNEAAPSNAGRARLLAVTLVGWAALLTVQVVFTFQSPSLLNGIIAFALGSLFIFFLFDITMLRDLLDRGRVRFQLRLADSAYRSELAGLPNRNYLMAELRKEMPRARRLAIPFTLIHLAIDDLQGMKERYGEEPARSLVEQLVSNLKRVTRESDFFAHMGAASFCVMLNECSSALARNFLNRLPDSVVARVDGETIDVPIVARVYEYDLEALYASDVISEVEGKVPRRRWHRVIAPTWLIGRLAGQKPGHEGGTSGWLASSLEGQGISLRQPDAQGTPAGLGRSRL